MLLSVMLLATILVQAQRRGNPAQGIEKRVAHLTSELNLTTDQQAQLKEIFVEQHQNRRANGQKMREMDQSEREAFRAEHKEAKAAMDVKIAEVLTPAQLETYKSLEAERKANGGKRGGAKGGKGKGKGKGKRKAKNKEKATPEMRAQKRTDKLTETLGLNADQQTALYNLYLNQQSAKPKKGERGQLSDAEKEAMKAERQQQKAAFEAEIARILTPAQLEQYQNLPKKEKGKKKGKKNKR